MFSHLALKFERRAEEKKQCHEVLSCCAILRNFVIMERFDETDGQAKFKKNLLLHTEFFFLYR